MRGEKDGYSVVDVEWMWFDRVAKKKAILQSELSKMEQRLRDRTAVLSRLRRHHEELLNVNGQLQYVPSETISQLNSVNHVVVTAFVNFLCVVALCRQRNCLRKDKLTHLYESVNQVDGSNDAGGKAASERTEDAIPDSDTVLDKCTTMKQVVGSLIGKQELLEQGCMGMEDALVHKTDALRLAKQRLSEGKSQQWAHFW